MSQRLLGPWRISGYQIFALALLITATLHRPAAIIAANGLIGLLLLAAFWIHGRRKINAHRARFLAVTHWRQDESQPGMVLIPWTRPVYEDEDNV